MHNASDFLANAFNFMIAKRFFLVPNFIVDELRGERAVFYVLQESTKMDP